VRYRWVAAATFLVAVLAILVAVATHQKSSASATKRLQRQLDELVKAKGGPPGVIVTLRRGSRITVLTAGVADGVSRRTPRATDHMRIASVAKAFSGAVALRLVADGRLKLDDTIRSVLPDLPGAWSGVTVRQLLNHTSGLPDYTRSSGFTKQFKDDPSGYVPPTKILGWVRSDPLVFEPGTRYEYSNTDNIVVGRIAERVSGKSYPTLLREIVFQPLALTQTSLPTTPALARPFIHGYVVGGTGTLEDVSTLLNPSGAWASGGIVRRASAMRSSMRARGFSGGRYSGSASKPSSTIRSDRSSHFPLGVGNPPSA